MGTIGRMFIDAFNRRDVEGMVELSSPDVVFCPTLLVGARREYHGHSGLRRWCADLAAADASHQVRVREVRELAELRFVVLTEVLLDGELVSPSAMIADLDDRRLIAQARSYLSDEQTLIHLGLVSPDSAVRSCS